MMARVGSSGMPVECRNVAPNVGSAAHAPHRVHVQSLSSDQGSKMPETFDPAAHRFGPSRYFEDFVLGEAFYIPSRTVTEAQFLAFQAASGDNHPIHYDREYCRRHGHPDLLAHGYQVL